MPARSDQEEGESPMSNTHWAAAVRRAMGVAGLALLGLLLAGAATAWACANVNGPYLRELDPNQGSGATDVMVRGGNWTPGQVALAWHDSGGELLQTLGEATVAEGENTFVATVTVPGGAPGHYFVSATQDNALGEPERRFAQFQVLAPAGGQDQDGDTEPEPADSSSQSASGGDGTDSADDGGSAGDSTTVSGGTPSGQGSAPEGEDAPGSGEREPAAQEGQEATEPDPADAGAPEGSSSAPDASSGGAGDPAAAPGASGPAPGEAAQDPEPARSGRQGPAERSGADARPAPPAGVDDTEEDPAVPAEQQVAEAPSVARAPAGLLPRPRPEAAAPAPPPGSAVGDLWSGLSGDPSAGPPSLDDLTEPEDTAAPLALGAGALAVGVVLLLGGFVATATRRRRAPGDA